MKTLQRAYELIVACGSIFVVAMAVVATLEATQPAGLALREHVGRTAQSDYTGSCIPQFDRTTPAVGGLARNDVPRLPYALRVNYDDTGNSQYAVPSDEREILGYYLPKLAAGCWELYALTPHEGIWTKGNQAVRIAIQRNPLGGRTLVNYQALDTAVLGLSYKVAQSDPSACTAGQIYCPGMGCYPSGSTCPAAPTTGTACGTPPTGCTYGYTYDTSGCATGCQAAPSNTNTGTPPPSNTNYNYNTNYNTNTTSCTSSYAQAGTYACNYATCPNGCSYDGSGCPSGCYTSPTCTGTYQQPGATYPSCNNSVCPNGCNWSNGCPSGCYTPVSCTGTYQQPNITYPSCNYGTCPSGCTWGANGCPTGCQSATPSCPSGQYWCTSSNMCVSNTAPCGSATGGACPSGMYSCNGSCIANTASCSPTGGTTQASCTGAGGLWCQPTYSPHCHYGPNPPACEPDTQAGGTSSCPAGYFWCPSSYSCIPSSSTCPTTPPPGTDRNSCISAGGQWCQPTYSPHCHPGPASAPCEPDVPTGTASCPSNQYWCNGACVPTSSSCPTPTSCPSGQYLCNNACTAVGSPCNGYPYYPPGSGSCAQGTYWCGSTNACVPNSSSCGSPGTGSCPSGQYWCPSTSSCKSSSESCAPSGNINYNYNYNGNQNANYNSNYNTNSIPSCPSGQYFCPATNSCKNNADSCGPTPQPAQCPAGRFFCPSRNACISSSETCAVDIGAPHGPTDEELRRIDEEQFRQMKRGLEQFTRGFKQMERVVKRMETRLAAAGVGIPPELKAAIAKAPEIIEKIKNAKTADELDELAADIFDVTEAMREWAPRFGDLQRLGEMLKQATREVRNIDRAVKRVQASAKRNTALEISAAEITTLAAAMTKASAEVKQLAKTEPDIALDKLETEFYDRMEEFWNLVSEADMIQNLSRGVNQAKREISRNEQKIRTLERRKSIGTDVITELKNLIADTKEKLADIQALAREKASPDEVQLAAGELWDLFTDFENRMEEIGQGFYESTAKRGEDVRFEVPEGFDFRIESPAPTTPTFPATPGIPATSTLPTF